MHGFFSLPGFLPVAEEATGSNHELRQSFRASTPEPRHRSARRPPGDRPFTTAIQLARAAEVPWARTRQKSPSAGLIERVAHGEKLVAEFLGRRCSSSSPVRATLMFVSVSTVAAWRGRRGHRFAFGLVLLALAYVLGPISGCH